MKEHLALRRDIIAACRKMNALGINQGTSGNISVRVPEGLLITPSGMAYETLEPKDIVAIGLDGSVAPGQRRPSSEWRFHCDIMATRFDAGAVVHTHAMFATTLACLHRDIPAFHYMVAVAGGDSIRCAPYATFGTQELSDHALTALEGRRACLLANHGMIAIGADLDGALALAVEVETLAAQYWRTLQIGEPVLLSEDEMRRVLEKFETYGRQAERASGKAKSEIVQTPPTPTLPHKKGGSSVRPAQSAPSPLTGEGRGGGGPRRRKGKQ